MGLWKIFEPNNWFFVLILVNIFIYIITLVAFFSLINLTNNFLLKSSDNFKNLAQTTFLYNCVVFLFLSLAGMPPLVSFVGKFFLFSLIFSNLNYLLIIVFFLFNCIVIYFYIQHLRFLIFNKKNSDFSVLQFFKKYSINLYFLITLIFAFLIFGSIFFADFVTLFLVVY